MTPINVARMWHFHFNVARMWHEITKALREMTYRSRKAFSKKVADFILGANS